MEWAKQQLRSPPECWVLTLKACCKDEATLMSTRNSPASFPKPKSYSLNIPSTSPNPIFKPALNLPCINPEPAIHFVPAYTDLAGMALEIGPGIGSRSSRICSRTRPLALMVLSQWLKSFMCRRTIMLQISGFPCVRILHVCALWLSNLVRLV